MFPEYDAFEHEGLVEGSLEEGPHPYNLMRPWHSASAFAPTRGSCIHEPSFEPWRRRGLVRGR